MRHPLLSFRSFTASSLFLLDAASSLVFEGLACGSSLGGFQYVCFFQNLRVKLFSGAREDFLNILTCTCTSLETLVNALTLGKLDRSVEGDLSRVFELTLVSDQVNSHILGGVLLNFLQPAPQVVESLVTGDIVCQEHAVRATVEDPGDGFEGLLPCLNQSSFVVIQIFPEYLPCPKSRA